MVSQLYHLGIETTSRSDKYHFEGFSQLYHLGIET